MMRKTTQSTVVLREAVTGVRGWGSSEKYEEGVFDHTGGYHHAHGWLQPAENHMRGSSKMCQGVPAAGTGKHGGICKLER